MKLYSYWRSSSAWRVRLALNVKGIAYDYVAVNLAPDVREQTSPAYAAVNAFQQVPTLAWAGATGTERLTQSVAIIEYLEQLQPEPALLPADPLQRARVREAVQIVNSGTQPLQNTSVLAEIRQLAGESGVSRWALRWIGAGLAALEAHARQHAGRYLIGDALSMADLYLVPQLYNARRFGVELAPYATLTAIDARLQELEAFIHARPELQPDAAA
jgi:maleylpyruvate isomerase